VVRRARGWLRRKREVPVERLREDRFGRYVIRRWERTVAELDARAALPPQLQNTDGDPLLLTTDEFDITPGAGPAVAAQLAEWPDVPLPALNGQTPRDAVRTPEGRLAVDLLLREMENQERRAAGATAFDFATVRHALDL